MTEGGDDDDEDERRAQIEFEQSLRESSMSFFKTAKSTFMSTNDLESKSLMNESYPAWGEAAKANRGEEEVDCTDLAANGNQIMAGGSMSILRRKGKQLKDRRGSGRGAKFNYELLSGDILTLMQVFHDEANAGDVSREPPYFCLTFPFIQTRDRSASIEEPTIIRPKTMLGSSSQVKLRPSSNRKVRPGLKQQISMTSLKDPKLAAVA